MSGNNNGKTNYSKIGEKINQISKTTPNTPPPANYTWYFQFKVIKANDSVIPLVSEDAGFDCTVDGMT
jgi:hypothetical protein